MSLSWHVNGRFDSGDRFVQDGCIDDLSGAVHACVHLEGVTLGDVRAEMPLETSETDRIFMNGYQTWTFSPEYTRHSSIRGLHGTPSAAVSHFSLDRYGDYHFVPYLDRSGILHGFSWMTVRSGDHFRLIGSLDERPGYTIFTYDAKMNFLYLKRDCMDVKCTGDFHAFDLFFAEGTQQEVYDAWFAAMGIHERTDEKLFGYSSWYNRYQDISEAAIMQDLSGCETILKEGDLFQIDDGWEPFIGDWLEENRGKFPQGMKSAAERIHASGFKAGLWLAPFVAEENSELYKKHPDWLLKINGEPWKLGCNWSGFYSLDIDHPEVQQYLKDVFSRVFDEWGFDLVKLDFLYGAAPFGTTEESRAGRMYRAWEMLRELCGDHLILGCGTPVMPAFGYADYCRISCDVTLDWNDKLHMRIIHRERPSTRQAIINTINRFGINGRAHLNDPDVFFLRTENCSLNAKQKELLAMTGALLGGIWLTSDDPSSYTEEMKQDYRRYRYISEHARNISLHYGERPEIAYELDGTRRSFVLNFR